MSIQENEDHYILRSSWLRATVLGANDGLISTSSLIVGVVLQLVIPLNLFL